MQGPCVEQPAVDSFFMNLSCTKNLMSVCLMPSCTTCILQGIIALVVLICHFLSVFYTCSNY
jgi:hypothetical protein